MSRILFSALAIICLSASISPAGEPLQVEDRGEPQKFRFAGLAAFTPAQISAALETDVDFLLAAHPRASFAQMLSVLEEKITLGYQNVGFPRAQTSARYDEAADQVVVRVAEGRRFCAGPVHVLGVKRTDAEKLSNWIVASKVTDNASSEREHKDPLEWNLEQPVSFVPWTWKKFEKRVKSGLAAQGFHFPKFAIDVEPDEATQTAALLVKIEEEGPAGVIGAIEISGSELCSSEQVLAYLKLKTPVEFTDQLQPSVSAALRDCGRFLWHQVELTPPPNASGQTKMSIKLRDNLSGITPLGEEFTRAERAMLKMAQWIEQSVQRNDDLILRARGGAWLDQVGAKGSGELELIISPTDGAYARLMLEKMAGARLEFELLLAPDRVTLASAQRAAFLQVIDPWKDVGNNFGVVANLQIKGNLKPTSKGTHVALVFGYGITYDPKGGVPPIRVTLGCDPAAALYNLYRPGTEVVLRHSQVIVRQENSTIEMDETSGKLVRCEQRKAGSADEFSLSIEHRALAARRKAIEQRLNRPENKWEGRLPLTSIARFVTDEYFHVRKTPAPSSGTRMIGMPRPSGLAHETPRQIEARVMKRLLDRACRAGDDWLALAEWKPSQDEFKLPPPNAATAQNWQQMLTTPLLQGARFCFPRESPPWTLSRETAFLLAGKSAHAQYQLAAVLNSTSTGPISGLYGSGLFRFLNPDMSRRFARQSLVRTDARYFRRDLEWLLAKECIIRAPLLDMATTLREFEPEELRGLASLLGSDPMQRAAIARALSQLKTDPQQSTEDALPATLEALWEAVLKQYVERWLQLLSQQGLTGKA